MEELTYNKLEVGKRFAERDFVVEPEAVRRFKQATQDPTPDDGVAPTGLAAVFARLAYLKEYHMPGGGVLARESLAFHGPFVIGETLRLQAEVAEKYVRRERPYATIAVKALDPRNSVVCTGSITLIWPK